MAGKEQAIAYANSNLEYANKLFVENLTTAYRDNLVNVLDLCCGPAYVPVMLVKQLPDAKITAVDGSAEMLKLANQIVDKEGVRKQITLLQGTIPGLDLAEHVYDAVISKDSLHHFHDPNTLWEEIKRLGKPGAAVYVMDLFRRTGPQEARMLVNTLTPGQSPLLQADFYNSLLAAFTVEEVKGQIKDAKLDLAVEQYGDYHLVVHGKL